MSQHFDPHDILPLPLMANLATVSANGSPRNAPVWFIWEDNRLWMPGTTSGSTVRRLEKNPQCAVEIVHYDNKAGILLHLGFRGNATIEASAPDRFKRLLSKYLGNNEAAWNQWFIDNICLLYTSPSPRDATLSRMPSSA